MVKKNNKKSLVKAKDKPIKKQLSAEDIKEMEDIVNNGLSTNYSPSTIVKEMAKEVKEMTKDTGSFQPEPGSATYKYFMMESLENHFLLTACCDEEYRPFVLKFVADLIAEYKCETPSEKALAQIVANAYYRILRCSRSYNNYMHPEYLSHEKASFLGNYSKELDRATRQFNFALQTLKIMKQPPLKMTVKANNAYLAQNQQVNTVVEDSTTPLNKTNDEIIDQQ